MLQLLTALGTVGATAGAGAATDASSPPVESRDAPSITSPADVADQEQDQPVGTEALLSYLEAKYGDMLTEADLSTLEEEVAGNISTAQALDDTALANGDDMALRFEPYRGEWD
ncbi:hypothetical protein HZS55_09415 [Halosimplex rubrum]|uniref:Uncharacterized protein n=1 Tax=Halosimplex rubrum TaxID=869889 RepID=A0A7D5PAA2_9EURY|nr:hypothetical protein [Halosimplex rubrum]QLH77499.1 hypothetical protein HZS55_09415 [Halosimplex rubrum]